MPGYVGETEKHILSPVDIEFPSCRDILFDNGPLILPTPLFVIRPSFRYRTFQFRMEQFLQR
jgi:hypothetical protein